MWLESIGLGLIIFFMLLGFIGAFLPLLPGPLLVWFAALVYVIATKFTVVSYGAFAVISVIALVASTADIWMPLLGAKVLGGSSRALLFGMGGAVVGFFIFSLLGALIGYALGILYGEYRKHQNWGLAFKASVGGLAGWGISTAVQAGGALLMIIIFLWQVLS